MLITFMFSMHATPFFYQGDEIGMANIRFDKIEDYRDIETIHKYALFKRQGKDVVRFLEAQKETARDNSRTPVQWNNEAYAGFTTGQPWIAVNPDYERYNIEAQERDPASILHFFRRMIGVRKKHPALIYGDYNLIDPDHTKVFAYTRILGAEQLFIVLNFSKEEVIFSRPLPVTQQVLINNYDHLDIAGKEITLLPYQALIFQL
jgi:oligo-1,6-glucosidase